VKQYISKVLKIVAAFYLAFPLAYIVLAAIMFDIPFNRCGSVLVSPFYYFVSFFSMVAGYGLWEMRRWAWYYFVIAQVMVVYENAHLVHRLAESHHKVLVFAISIFFQIVLIFRVAREIRVPYLFPKIRWWESNPRYRLTIPVSLHGGSGESQQGQILDVSVAGCFIKLRNELKLDESIQVAFQIFGFDVLCEGKVVWNAQSTVTHPKGVGIKFNSMPRPQRRSLRLIARRLRKISALYRSSRYLMSQEDFLKHLSKIESKGREKSAPSSSARDHL
jgi:hypothetical protein